PIGTDDVHIGPSDYVPWLKDRKWAHIRMEGKAFGEVPLSVDLKLEVHDSPNSAGIVIDAVRCCKLGLDRGLSGALEGPASYFMKSPPFQVSDERAHELTELFIEGRVGAACISDPEAPATGASPGALDVLAPDRGEPATVGTES
ncbi:myo-inositol-1-phosphate synthase, partial [mine drainage metagenome]